MASTQAAECPFRGLSESRAVLVVDDSGYSRLRTRRLLAEEGFTRILEAENGDDALVVFEKESPALVLIDQVMRGKEGIEVSRLLLERDPLARVAILTVLSDPEIHWRARKAGAIAVVNKNDQETLRFLLRTEKGRFAQ